MNILKIASRELSTLIWYLLVVGWLDRIAFFQDISTGALRMPTTMMMTRRGKGRSPCSSRGSRRSRPGSLPSSQTLPAEVCKIKVILSVSPTDLNLDVTYNSRSKRVGEPDLIFWEWVQIFYCYYMISGLRSFTTG